MNAQELAVVALGSNLDDSAGIILRAIERLQTLTDGPLLKSSLWQTTPVDCPPGSPMFINAVIGFQPRPEGTALGLLRQLLAWEKEFGRQPKKILNEARRLDLDLIAFKSQIIRSAELTLPHPRAHLRQFVLQPLREIAPDLILPEQVKTILQLAEDLPPDQAMRRL